MKVFAVATLMLFVALGAVRLKSGQGHPSPREPLAGNNGEQVASLGDEIKMFVPNNMIGTRLANWRENANAAVCHFEVGGPLSALWGIDPLQEATGRGTWLAAASHFHRDARVELVGFGGGAATAVAASARFPKARCRRMREGLGADSLNRSGLSMIDHVSASAVPIGGTAPDQIALALTCPRRLGDRHAVISPGNSSCSANIEGRASGHRRTVLEPWTIFG